MNIFLVIDSSISYGFIDLHLWCTNLLDLIYLNIYIYMFLFRFVFECLVYGFIRFAVRN